MHSIDNINDLPIEIFLEILKKADGVTFGKCRNVCQQWKDCVDSSDFMWHYYCQKEYKSASKIAKKKDGNECQWYHIYKNLKMWSKVITVEKNLRDFYQFSSHDSRHALNIEYGVLPLKDTRGILLYDMGSLKHIPVAIPEKNCWKIANTDLTSVILTKSGMLVQRNVVNNSSYMSEGFFNADKFVLSQDLLYFAYKGHIFKCDLKLPQLTSHLVYECKFKIIEMQYSDGMLHLFSDDGRIVSIDDNNVARERPLRCPIEWIKQIKHITAVDNTNFVCYSRNLFKIETDKYQHLYLDFPPITALFFYVDIVLIGTKNGDILLYRLSDQKKGMKPIFENIAVLPRGKFAVSLDVVERRTGPVIVVATFFEIMVIELNFFPHEPEIHTRYLKDKLNLYKRLLKIKDRLHGYF